MTMADRAAFAAYCQAWARWIEAEKGESGSAQERTLRLLLTSIQRFGLSPADRTKLASAEAPSAPTGIAGLLD
jgi:phage terminase small subunit